MPLPTIERTEKLMTEEEICKRLRAIDDYLVSLGLSLFEDDEAEEEPSDV